MAMTRLKAEMWFRMTTMPDVAFCRSLKPGMRGDDVVAHKRAVSRVDPKAYPWRDFTPLYGQYFESAVRKIQRAHGITPSGRIGKPTHELLERLKRKGHPRQYAFGKYEQKMAQDFCDGFTQTPDEKVRDLIVAAGFYWYAHRGTIAYSQFRPMQLGKPPWVPSRWDCSGFVTACHYAGGAPDPNGRGYDHQGYTGTLMSTGRAVGALGQLDPGDFIFYGRTTNPSPAFPFGSPTHVALYVGKVNGVESVLSHGHFPMALYRFDYRPVNHFRHYDVTR